ncbi:hypothetical protein KIW84_010145 [Lathyrus oleraceus]|uniref:Uncharacterized protein n=1 Tax=Pisum sativum TaxID=3888 RepID=A0A9D4YML3_PEA|nr:hypothetical protein KIW84_010145 [Pisum sativum]
MLSFSCIVIHLDLESVILIFVQECSTAVSVYRYESQKYSEFQEHDLVSLITQSPVESSSAAATATDAVLKNFFNAPKFTGPYASNVDSFQQPYHSATVNSTVPSVFLPPVHSLQMPSTSLKRINSGNPVTNLVKPST